jgi:hypothetical protein
MTLLACVDYVVFGPYANEGVHQQDKWFGMETAAARKQPRRDSWFWL